MIASIRGTLSEKSAHYIVVDVQGVGYGVYIPLSTFYNLPETGQPVTLAIYTHVKEDLINLFGFLTTREKEIFKTIISVSGIGPRLAINILSGISADELCSAISAQDFARLTGIPGVGKKMAERIIFELKDKMFAVMSEISDREPGRQQPVKEDALSALMNLGYRKKAAEDALDIVLRGAGGTATLEELLTESLKILSN
ncbi:MAG: Holliday junction branch migration protein RuvA [Deltaproteobacteria bacterium]|nr:Holliday junction branch migration protein RuvA [Deltaproteobacteria bacterium]